MAQPKPSPGIVYSSHYDIRFFGIERVHPFDSRKYSRAWKLIRSSRRNIADDYLVPVDRAASDEELTRVHTPEYLRRLKDPRICAAALEVDVLKHVPGWLLRWRVARPMRWAVRGSILGAVEALERGLVINLSGGYHHAKPDQGEGFCLFSDIALAIDAIRTSAPGREGGRIAYIDLDAHQGNGVCHHFLDDREVFVFDMYNATIYPWFDVRARERIDCDVPLPRGCDGSTYLGKLKERLPAFLDSVTSSRPVLLAVFNAGSDILAGDPLGGLGVSADEILERDRFVIAECGNRQIPVLMLPSGGYTRQSYQVIARTVLSLLPSCESGSGAIR